MDRGWDRKRRSEYTVETLKERVRKLERELFYLDELVDQKGFWKEAQKYIKENRDEPIPFEIK